jgi:hypothetical protein
MQQRVKLHRPDVPDELRRLFSTLTDRDAYILESTSDTSTLIFFFTSLGANLDHRYNTPKGLGIYTFWIHG